VQPQTGRRHQIRKHLKHISHPIIGDIRYGKGTHNRFFREQFGVQRLLLSAQRLCFQHPLSGEAMDIHAADDSEWLRVIQEAGL